MRLAHCSDLHLLSLDGSRWLDFMSKRWIGGLNLLTNRGRHYQTEIFESLVDDLNTGTADQVLVTGDITNLALEPEFEFARKIFDRISLGTTDTTVIPGNHDAYVAEGSTFFARHFADFFAPDPEFAWDDGDDDPWPIVRIRGQVAIIGLSTSLQTPWFTAYGVVGDKQAQRLDKVLRDERLAGLFRLVAIHHPPAGDRAKSRVRGLRDRHKFAEVLAGAGAELVLHGHEHRDLANELPGPSGLIPVSGIQSGTYDGGDPERLASYRVFEIGDPAPAQRPALVGATMRRYDPATKRFSDALAETGENAAQTA